MGVFSNFYNNFYQYLGRRIGHNSFNLFIMQLGTRYLTVSNDYKKININGTNKVTKKRKCTTILQQKI